MQFQFRHLILFWMLPLFLYSQRFKHIDQHALNTPKSAEESIESLARYLTAPARNDSDKVRAIFRWVTANITYDTSIYFTGTPKPHKLRTGNILKDRTAVCDGYSTLMESLGHAAGLKIEKIEGHAKGVGYKIGDKMTGPSDHAWNAIFLGGHWQLFDATWGAGYMDEKGQFVRHFQPYYFLTSPLDMIYTHFPDNPDWQLLKPRVTMKEFEALPFVKPAFHHYGLEMVNHHNGSIRWNDSTIVAINNPKNARIIAILMKENQELDRSLTFVQQFEDQIHIQISPPEPGAYLLRLFAKGTNEPNKYQWALDYILLTNGVQNKNPGFPETYTAFFKNNAYLRQPLTKTLKNGALVMFDIIIPNAISTHIIQGDNWTPMLQSDNRFAQQVAITGKEIMIGAKFTEGDKHHILLKYKVKP